MRKRNRTAQQYMIKHIIHDCKIEFNKFGELKSLAIRMSDDNNMYYPTWRTGRGKIYDCTCDIGQNCVHIQKLVNIKKIIKTLPYDMNR